MMRSTARTQQQPHTHQILLKLDVWYVAPWHEPIIESVPLHMQGDTLIAAVAALGKVARHVSQTTVGPNKYDPHLGPYGQPTAADWLGFVPNTRW